MACPDIRHYLTRGQVAARGQEAVPLSVHADDALLLYRDPLIEPLNNIYRMYVDFKRILILFTLSHHPVAGRNSPCEQASADE